MQSEALLISSKKRGQCRKSAFVMLTEALQLGIPGDNNMASLFYDPLLHLSSFILH